MVSIKSLIMVFFISVVSATGETCTCGDAKQTKALCDTISNASFQSGGERCTLPDSAAIAAFRQNCRALGGCLSA
ncbi:hypothetical protein LZ554_007923 [Drepanopeziza brunnea f. sp. 'monogermtubi']|nr:hypothetical protein LZ554_007923 [Drepanopeziza brunnea f. sp. 'monogermtubi']